jgi:SAM-dependent methyltransferase
MSTTVAPDFAAITTRQQRVWSAGDFARVGSTNLVASELLCEHLGLLPGERVLDVAAGHGNTSLAAARRFCEVTATDFVPELLEQASQRAQLEHLPLTVRVADAQELPFSDGSFDVVVSTFGAMFAPDQGRVASELLRVCRPSGRIGLVSWRPDSFIADVFRAVATLLPPPPGIRPVFDWGDQRAVRELLDGARSVSFETEAFVWRFHSPDHMLEYLRTWYGPTNIAFSSLDDAGREALTEQLLDVFRRHNRAGDRAMVASSEYLEVIAVT